MNTTIERKHVDTICKIGQGAACCRYLACGGNGFECLKHSEHMKYLDKRAAAKDMHAQSDNCPGWLVEYFPTKETQDDHDKQTDLQ